MGQYYKFINKSRQEESQISLPFNFGLSWAKSLEQYDDDEVDAMFRFVIKHNEDWQPVTNKKNERLGSAATSETLITKEGTLLYYNMAGKAMRLNKI